MAYIYEGVIMNPTQFITCKAKDTPLANGIMISCGFAWSPTKWIQYPYTRFSTRYRSSEELILQSGAGSYYNGYYAIYGFDNMKLVWDASNREQDLCTQFRVRDGLTSMTKIECLETSIRSIGFTESDESIMDLM